ncbi:P-loop containing nucleoside triphosphate hydrolases superfamily protein [Actinidia rufa]|uniref:RNA helicase n=1 Tax=Actinidia rufa TaxID=165716 RepID=A0A7J0DD79_9ERIC|nr:P-loop containing nucleoside triphosphate hydrolases superfamily protein [Actinidia rufa]
MPTLATARFLVLAGDVLPLRKLSHISKRAPLYASVRFLSRTDRDNGPLTLASLGLKSDFEFETTNKKRKNNFQQPEASAEVFRSKVKPVKSTGIKEVQVKNPLEIEGAPFAAKSFPELGLPPLLLERLEKEGFTVPTDVQSTAIPVILKDHDVVIQSYTGSGKTLAYLLPILSEVEKLLGPGDKKLVQQLVGGANRSRQEEALKKNKPAIVVGNTWTIPLLVQAKSVSPIESVQPSGPVNLTGHASSSSLSSNSHTQAAVESLPPALKHYYCVTRGQHKIDTLRRCVHALDAKSVIAFMNHTKQLKDAVFKLEARGMNAAELHGDLGKLGRSTILKKFKNGEVRVLVTNELSARGLDVAECDLVVNLELPTDAVHYAHRAGRTGRLGRKGTVVTVCEEPEVFVVKKLQRQLGVPIQACEFTEGKLLVTEEKAKNEKVGL